MERTDDDPLLQAIADLDELPARYPPHRTDTPQGGPSVDPAGDLEGMIESARTGKRPVRRAPDEAPGVEPPGKPSVPSRVTARIARAEEQDRGLHAFVHLDTATARREAARVPADAPLAGTLIGHKDIVFTAGQPTTAGSELLREHVPTVDAEVVRRLRSGGAVSLGKLATHEFATGVTGTVSAFPTPVNPRSPDRVPGGSSCGSAAAVAAGLVDLATATDTGGSIRIPSACCGTVGFKPTLGRVPTSGVIPFSWTLDHVGPIAGSVALAAAAFEVMSGTSLPRIGRPPESALRFGLASELLSVCERPVADSLEECARRLEAAGHRVEPVRLPPLWHRTPAMAAAIFLAEGAAFHAPGLRGHRDRYCAATLQLLDRGRAVPAPGYLQAMRLRQELISAMEATLAGLDALLLPALPCAPPPLEAATVRLPAASVDVRAALTLFTRPANITGQPAIVIPVPARSDREPPSCAQLLGRRGTDATLLRAAQVLEAVVGGPVPVGYQA